jgi:hypothetical protein
MKFRHLVVAASLAAFVGAPLAWAAGLFPNLPIVGSASFCAANVLAGVPGTSTVCASTTPAGPLVLTGKELIPADTGLASGQAPQTVLIPSQLLGNYFTNGRNVLDNGAMAIQQRGTGTVTCGTTSGIPSSAYHADRWGCDANVTSGAGRAAVITATPAPPTGFPASVKIFRTSGALTQPICTWQEIPTVESTYLQGQTVTFSSYIAALAGLSADNGNVVNMVVIAGTGTDEGFGTMTASPAITPAWTGISTVTNTAQNITTSFVRYSVTVTVPATATELAAGICFTPTATGAGATDGFAYTGAQTEVAPSPTAFEFRRVADELRQAQRYFFRVTEGSTVATRASCGISTTSIANCLLNFPVTMRVAPTMTYTTGFESCATTACTSATACTALTTSATLASTAVSPNNVLIDCASSAGFGAAGTTAFLYDTATPGGLISASADF